jgi:hypothetical protein
MLECNQVAYIVLGVERKIGYKRKGNTSYQGLPDGTPLDRLDRRKFYYMHITPEGTPAGKTKELVLLGKIIESCTKPEWDYRKFKKIDLREIERKAKKESKPLLDALNAHKLDIKEQELQLYLVAVHS